MTNQPHTELAAQARDWAVHLEQANVGRTDQYIAHTLRRCAAALSHPSTQGWKLAPVEPDSAMLDRAVAFALNVFLSSEYRWTDYMKDLWATMLAGSPPPPEQGGKG